MRVQKAAASVRLQGVSSTTGGRGLVLERSQGRLGSIELYHPKYTTALCALYNEGDVVESSNTWYEYFAFCHYGLAHGVGLRKTRQLYARSCMHLATFYLLTACTTIHDHNSRVDYSIFAPHEVPPSPHLTRISSTKLLLCVLQI